MSLNVKNIKSVDDIETYIDGCLNDFEFGILTKEETKEHIAELMLFITKKSNKK